MTKKYLETILTDKEASILQAFELDANKGVTVVAKYLGIKAATITSIVTKLINENVCVRHRVIDVAPFGIHEVAIYLSYICEDLIEHQIVDVLKRSNRVSWVLQIDGEYNISFGFAAQNIGEIDECLARLWDISSSFKITKKKIVQYIRWWWVQYNIHPKAIRESLEVGAGGISTNLCNTDFTLARLLLLSNKDNRGINDELRYSKSSFFLKLQNLRKEGVYKRDVLIINPSAIGLIAVKFLVCLSREDKVSPEDVSIWALHHGRVVFLIRCFGEWSWEINCTVSAISEISECRRDIIALFQDAVIDIRTLMLMGSEKRHKFP